MTMRWTEGFYTAENATNLALKYDYVNTANMSPSYGRTTIGTNSYGANIPAATGAYIVKSLKSVITSATTGMIVGFRYKMPATGATNGRNFFGIRNQAWSDANGYDSTGTFNAVTKQLQGSFYLELVSVSGSTAGFLLRRRDMGGNTPTTLYTSSTTVLSTTTFAYIEMAVWANTNTTARVVLRINGTQVYDSGATISWNYGGTIGPANEILPYGIYDGVNASANTAGGVYADMYVCDDQGTTNNNFLGDTVIETALPTGDGTTQQFSTPAPNLLTTNQWSLESGATTGWAADTAHYASSTAPSATTAQHFVGSYSLTFAQNFADGGITTPTGTSGVPVSPATTYTFAARGLQTQTNIPQFGMVIDWYDSSGTFISSSTVYSTLPGSGAGWTIMGGSAASPSNAAYATQRFYLTGGNPVNTQIWLDTITFYQGNVRDASNNPIFQAPSGHYTLLNDTSPDSTDSSYVRSSTSGSIEGFKYSLASASGLVAAVNFAPIVKREALGSNSLVPAVRTRGTPVVVEVGQSADWNASGHTDTMANTTQLGDIVLFWAVWTPSWPVNAPTGLGATWTQIYNDTANPSMGLWVGTGCSAGQSAISTTQTSGTNIAKTMWVLIRGAATTSPVIAQSTTSATSTAIVNGAISSTFANQLVITFWQSLVGSGYTYLSTADSPGGFNVDVNTNAKGGVARVEIAHRIVSEVGAQSHQININNAAYLYREYAVVIDPLISYNTSSGGSLAIPADTNYHQATGILEMNPAATSRALTIAEINAGDLGLVVP